MRLKDYLAKALKEIKESRPNYDPIEAEFEICLITETIVWPSDNTSEEVIWVCPQGKSGNTVTLRMDID